MSASDFLMQRVPRSRASLILLVAVPALLPGTPCQAGAGAVSWDRAGEEGSSSEPGPRSLAPEAEEICLACGTPVRASDRLIVHRGRRVPLHEGECVEAWNANRETLFAALQPRGALFQEHEAFDSPLRHVWIALGIYIVVGLILGAACGYIAVSRGHAPIPWFFAGLAVNLLALAALLCRPRGDLSRLPGGVPRGLAKVPTTRPPRPCPKCGSENHPAARRCARCGGALQPAVAPETERV